MSQDHVADLYIGGRWKEANSLDRIEIFSPHNEQRIGFIKESSAEDVDDAVGAAREAFDDGRWSGLPPKDRIEAIRNLLELYPARTDEIAFVMSNEVGLPIRETRAIQAKAPRAAASQLCSVAQDFPWNELRSTRVSGDVLIRREPVGVAAALVPSNAPLLILVAKVIPALLAGCTVVVKPAPEATGSTRILTELVDEAGLPPGVFNVITGSAPTGARLVSHSDIDKVSFTGSGSAGREVASSAARQLTGATLELGGKSAAIVLDDADLEHVIRGLRVWSFQNNGQSCLAQSRVLVPRARHDEFAGALGDLADSLVVGDPLDEATEVGPQTTEAQRDKVLRYIRVGIDEGARLVAGGLEAPSGLEVGWYVQPTVFVDCDNAMTIAREEIFGPVVCVIPHDGDDHAVAIANDSPYGLAGSVWTPDLERGFSVASRVRTGSMGINGYTLDYTIPFGGFKESGFGREYGVEGIMEFVQTKAIYGETFTGELFTDLSPSE